MSRAYPTKFCLSAILITALGLRLLFAIFIPHHAPDSQDYMALAKNILWNQTYRTSEESSPEAKRPPLYPFYMALHFKIFDTKEQVIRISQAFLLATIPLVIFWICRMLNQNTGVSLLASLLTAIHPELVVPVSFILTEALTTFFFTLHILFLIIGFQKKKYVFVIAAGLCLGLSTLCRPTTLLYPVFLILVFCCSSKGRTYAKFLFVFAFIAYATIAPWTIRNYLAFQRFLPVSIGFGDNLWKGSYLPWDGDYNYKDLSDMNQLIQGQDPFEAQETLLSEAIRNIRNKPAAYFLLCIKKVYRFWGWVPGNKRVLENKNHLKVILYVIHIPLLIFFVIGCTKYLRYWTASRILLVVPLIYFTLLHALLFAIPRYRIPIMPLFLIFAAHGILSLYPGSRSKILPES